jgi:hypothetical protein
MKFILSAYWLGKGNPSMAPGSRSVNSDHRCNCVWICLSHLYSLPQRFCVGNRDKAYLYHGGIRKAYLDGEVLWKGYMNSLTTYCWPSTNVFRKIQSDINTLLQNTLADYFLNQRTIFKEKIKLLSPNNLSRSLCLVRCQVSVSMWTPLG